MFIFKSNKIENSIKFEKLVFSLINSPKSPGFKQNEYYGFLERITYAQRIVRILNLLINGKITRNSVSIINTITKNGTCHLADLVKAFDREDSRRIADGGKK